MGFLKCHVRVHSTFHIAQAFFLVQAMTYFNEHKLTSASALLASRVKTEAPEMRNRDPEISVCFFGGERVSFLSKYLN